MRHILALLLALLFTPLTAQGYDAGAPCGRDANGNPYLCTAVDPNMLEATCMTSASPHYCLPYHQRACEVSGFQLACQLFQIGANCNGGDPGMCQYYVGLLDANRACALNGDQTACTWLQQQGF